jgi:hypothetical protein
MAAAAVDPCIAGHAAAGSVLGNLQRVLHIALTACFIWLLVRAVAAGERAILRSHPIDVSDNLKRAASRPRRGCSAAC